MQAGISLCIHKNPELSHMSFIRSVSGVRWRHPQRMKFKQAGFCEITSRGGYSGQVRIRAYFKNLRWCVEHIFSFAWFPDMWYTCPLVSELGVVQPVFSLETLYECLYFDTVPETYQTKIYVPRKFPKSEQRSICTATATSLKCYGGPKAISSELIRYREINYRRISDRCWQHTGMYFMPLPAHSLR